jgi:TusA-related sulfurtransferase
MKCIHLFIVIVTVLLASCQTLPVINSPMISADQRNLACPSPFLKEKYQLIHAIEITTAGNVQGAIIGITVADPSTRFVSSAIMTAEGMVLLEAQSGGEKLNILRALPPFDSGDFVINMIDDIKLIFFPPQGLLQQKGNLPDGSTACRWQAQNGDVIDVIASKPEITEIKKYSACGRLKRHIKLTQTAGNAYQSIELQGSGIVNYTLLMTLIEAQPAECELPGKEKLKVKNSEKSRRR